MGRNTWHVYHVTFYRRSLLTPGLAHSGPRSWLSQNPLTLCLSGKSMVIELRSLRGSLHSEMSEDRGLPPRKAPVRASAGFWRVSQISIYWAGSEWKTLELVSDKREYLEGSLFGRTGSTGWWAKGWILVPRSGGHWCAVLSDSVMIVVSYIHPVTAMATSVLQCHFQICTTVFSVIFS